MSIEELTEVCPPPKAPLNARGDWAAVEAKLGTPLPADYKALIETYGSGNFCELHPLNPFDPNPNIELVRTSQIVLAGDRETRKTFPKHLDGLPLHPEPGGVLPWAVHGNGGFVYWRMDGDPDGWPVIVLPSRELHGEEVPTTATTLLARWLGGGDVPSDLGAVDEPRFTPTRPALRRIEVFINPISDERTRAAERIAKHLGKAKDRGKHVSDHYAQWHFETDRAWRVTFNHHPDGYGQIWVDLPPADEPVLEALVVALPETLGWTFWNIVAKHPDNDKRVPAWPHVPRAPELEATPATKPKKAAPKKPAAKAKAKAKPKPKPKPKAKPKTKAKAKAKKR